MNLEGRVCFGDFKYQHWLPEIAYPTFKKRFSDMRQKHLFLWVRVRVRVRLGMSVDISKNWDNFRVEFEDYELATGLIEKPKEVRAAALRRLMGNECQHIYSRNIVLSKEQTKDTKAILDALGDYFKPAKNVIYERYMFRCCKQFSHEAAGTSINL